MYFGDKPIGQEEGGGGCNNSINVGFSMNYNHFFFVGFVL
jgi:hypothetical protein